MSFDHGCLFTTNKQQTPNKALEGSLTKRALKIKSEHDDEPENIEEIKIEPMDEPENTIMAGSNDDLMPKEDQIAKNITEINAKIDSNLVLNDHHPSDEKTQPQNFKSFSSKTKSNCKHCEEPYSTKNLRGHERSCEAFIPFVRVTENEDKPYQCQLCSNLFSLRRLAYRHIASNIRHMELINKSDEDEDMVKNHSKGLCEKCQSRVNPSIYEEHLESCNKLANFLDIETKRCNICDQILNDIPLLFDHVKNDHDEIQRDAHTKRQKHAEDLSNISFEYEDNMHAKKKLKEEIKIDPLDELENIMEGSNDELEPTTISGENENVHGGSKNDDAENVSESSFENEAQTKLDVMKELLNLDVNKEEDCMKLRKILTIVQTKKN